MFLYSKFQRQSDTLNSTIQMLHVELKQVLNINFLAQIHFINFLRNDEKISELHSGVLKLLFSEDIFPAVMLTSAVASRT